MQEDDRAAAPEHLVMHDPIVKKYRAHALTWLPEGHFPYFARTAWIRVVNWSGANGFNKYSAAPACSPAWISASCPLAERKITGMSFKLGVRFDHCTGFITGHARHAHIHQDQIGDFLLGQD